jgi:acetyltransferase-like isoleucine patch superfamily enzyme
LQPANRIAYLAARRRAAACPATNNEPPMAFLPLRAISLDPVARQACDDWLNSIELQLADAACDRNELCRSVLTDLYYPQYRDTDPATLPPATRIALLQMDPRNITLEPEYYSDCDPERYARVKPLLWLWEMFDKSILGENVDLGVRFRRILAQHVFKRCGANFKCFHFVKFSFGYNMEVGDGVVVHRHVLLDDRGGIILGNRVSISDFANIYSHSHDLGEQREVRNVPTVLGDGVRITYHATVLAGTHIEPDAMLGAMALATKDIPSGKVAVGIPAHPRFDKPPMEQRPRHPRTTDPLAEG